MRLVLVIALRPLQFSVPAVLWTPSCPDMALQQLHAAVVHVLVKEVFDGGERIGYMKS